ncbi:MAG: hypothetical protein JKY22_04020 [Flavobacteriaceae bacterium]|nr:hypothetical protein [Flavobacteriaceae bacterium]
MRKKIKPVIALMFLTLSAVFFTSCEDTDKHRFPEVTNGGFVKFVFQPDVWEGIEAAPEGGFSIVLYHIGADPAEASFTALTEDPSGNVASYELFVRGTFEGAPEDPIAYKSTTVFPFDVSYSSADMATLFNVPVETFVTGDEFFFTSTTTLTNGTVYNSTATGSLFDEEGEPLSDTWNGGTIDGVLLQGGDTGTNLILPAIYWTVKYLDPSPE